MILISYYHLHPALHTPHACRVNKTTFLQVRITFIKCYYQVGFDFHWVEIPLVCAISSFLASHSCSVGDYEAAIQDYHQKGCKFMLRFYRSKRKGLSLYNADNLSLLVSYLLPFIPLPLSIRSSILLAVYSSVHLFFCLSILYPLDLSVHPLIYHLSIQLSSLHGMNFDAKFGPV